MSMIGHNKGPSLEGGASWRKHCWQKARRKLVPVLPIEILRRRVSRAAELGLDYKSYASIRAASGHDVIAFLFSSNALRVFASSGRMPEDRLSKLTAVGGASQLAAALPPLTPERLLQTLPRDDMPLFASSFAAPDFRHSWGETRAILLQEIYGQSLPRDGVVVIGDTHQERGWSEAARLAGYVSADRFFGVN